MPPSRLVFTATVSGGLEPFAEREVRDAFSAATAHWNLCRLRWAARGDAGSRMEWQVTYQQQDGEDNNSAPLAELAESLSRLRMVEYVSVQLLACSIAPDVAYSDAESDANSRWLSSVAQAASSIDSAHLASVLQLWRHFSGMTQVARERVVEAKY